MAEDEVDFNDTVIAFIEIKMRRNGLMSIGGTITDEAAVLSMLDTARATMVENFKRQRAALAAGKPAIIVPGYDTAATGTPYEKKLINAVNDLHKAHDNRKILLP